METHIQSLERSLNATMKMLKKVEEQADLGDNHEVAYKLLRAVLHALRDRLMVDDAVKFGAQLPTVIRGLYYEGWKPSRVPIKMHKEEFMDRVFSETYIARKNPEKLIHDVLVAIGQYVDQGTLDKIKKTLPKDLAEWQQD